MKHLEEDIRIEKIINVLISVSGDLSDGYAHYLPEIHEHGEPETQEEFKRLYFQGLKRIARRIIIAMDNEGILKNEM